MAPLRIAVVGLGSMGAQVLWQLAARGVEVIGFERYAPGNDRGAAGGESRIFRSAHFEDSRYVPLLRRADELFDRLQRESGRELRDFAGCVLMGPPDHHQMSTALRSVSDHDLDHELLDSAELTRRFPQLRMERDDIAMLDHRAGLIRPELTILSAVAQAEKLGADVRRYCPVHEITQASNGVRITTANGTVDVDRVVVTAGPWINELVPAMRSLITVRRPISAWFVPRTTAPLAGSPVFIRTAPRHFYGVPTPDGSSVKLGLSVTDHLVTDRPDEAERGVAVAELAPFTEIIERYLPGLAPDPIRLATYLEGYTEDSRPVIELAPDCPDVLVLAGFSGHGFKLSPAIGQIGADLALTDATELPIEFLSRTH